MADEEKPWHAAFPAPTLTAPIFPQRQALMILAMKIASMLIVDVRRTDYEGGLIRGSINMPAQSLWWNRGILYELAYKSDIEWVVFTCGSCKENSRGARCAAWFLEHVRNTVGDEDMQVGALEGGLKGWIKAGPQYTQFMDGFDIDFWKRQLGSEWPEGIVPKSEGPGIDAERLKADEEINRIARDTENNGDGDATGLEAAEGGTASVDKKWSWEAMMED